MSIKDRLAALAEKKRAKNGNKRSYEYDDDDDAIYDEVSEEQYRKHQLARLKEDNFVVDDNGEGYVDDGGYEWEGHNYGESEEEERRGETRISKKVKVEKKPKNNGNVDVLFKRAADLKPVVKKVTKEDDLFLDDMLNGLGEVKKEKKIVRKSGKISLPNNKSSIGSYDEMGGGLEMEAYPSSPPAQYGEVDDGIDDDRGGDVIMDEEEEVKEVKEVKNGDKKAEEAKEEEIESDSDEELGMKKINSSKVTRFVNASSIKTVPKLPTELNNGPKNQKNGGSGLIGSSDGGFRSSDVQVVVSSQGVSGKIDENDIVDENGKFLFYFMDHAEIGSTLLLFGKVKVKDSDKYVSCTLKVTELCRDVYFLPNDDVEMGDVHGNLETVFKKEFNTNIFPAKPVVRKYCFELPNIPRESEYLKVLIPFDFELPENFENKLSTVKKIFGSKTGMFEQFVLSRNIMGPNWLEVSGGKFDNSSETNSKVSVLVDDAWNIKTDSSLSSLPAPPLNVLSMSLKSIMDKKSNTQEILCIVCHIYNSIPHDITSISSSPKVIKLIRRVDAFPPGFNELISTRSKKNNIIVKFDNESRLIDHFADILNMADIDVLIGHQLENIQLNVLLHRMKSLNSIKWKSLGKYKHSRWPNRVEIKQTRDIFAGRLLCDISNDMGRSITMKCDTWSLQEMTSIYTDRSRPDMDIDVTNDDKLRSAQGLELILNRTADDAEYTMLIAVKVQILPLSKQLTNLAGNSWARTLTGTRSDRNEFILLHEFFREKYIVPDKLLGFKSKSQQPQDVNNPSKAKYKGGLVFEPEKGLYKSIILVMDFNSLYPSIIQEFNICFTTVDRSKFNANSDEPPPLPDSSESKGILPRLIETLVNRRREVKKLMKSPSTSENEKSQYDIKQQALKLTANSMYGCLGFESSRFYALPLAMLTTYKGREILSNTKELMENNGLAVVYGDTDSVMINTNSSDFQEAINIGNELKKKVNDRYQKLEIDIDNVFKRLLLLQKKKYAAINMTRDNSGAIKTTMEIKGLDMKRREFCQLSKDISKHILDEILNQDDDDDDILNNIHDYLKLTRKQMDNKEIKVGLFVLKNKLGKDPAAYNDKPPQVHVALRRREKGEIIKMDDVITYIITNNEQFKTIGEKARTFTEVVKDKLDIDNQYYIEHQIFPVVDRLCAHLRGYDKQRIGECLGVEVKQHNVFSSSTSSNELQPLESTITDEERFKDSTKFTISCNCNNTFIYNGLQIGQESTTDSTGIICPSCKENIPSFQVNCQLEHAIRKEITNYYQGWLLCDDTSCGTRTRQINVYGKKCLGQEGACRGLMFYEYPDKKLYNQLLYFDSLFNVDRAKKNAQSSNEQSQPNHLDKQQIDALVELNRTRFSTTRSIINKYLNNCGRRYVDMYGIFNFM